MPKLYSSDLKKKIITALEEGYSSVAVSDMFKISRKTIYNWQLKLRTTGSMDPNKSGPKGMSRKIQDLDAFKKFVERKPDRSSEEIAKDWGDITGSTIRRYLRSMNFTYKKNIWIQKSL